MIRTTFPVAFTLLLWASTSAALDPSIPQDPPAPAPTAAPAAVQSEQPATADQGVRKPSQSWGPEFGFEIAAGISSRSIAKLHALGGYAAPHMGLRFGHDDAHFSFMFGGSYSSASTTRGLATSVWTVGPRFGMQFGILGFAAGVGLGKVSIRRATTGEFITDLGLDFNVDVRVHVLRWSEREQGGLFVGLHGDALIGTQVSPAGVGVLGVAF
jgi:hypothetical protein